MKQAHRASIVAVAVVSLGFAGCGTDRPGDMETTRDGVSTNDTRDDTRFGATDALPTATTVTGCLTEADGRYMLTQLQPGAAAPGVGAPDAGARAVPTTEAYELVGDTAQLRDHVGHQVRVSGEAPPAQVADMREISPTQPVGTTGAREPGVGTEQSRDGAGEPRVGTQQQTRIEATTLTVATVTPTGDTCPATNQ